MKYITNAQILERASLPDDEWCEHVAKPIASGMYQGQFSLTTDKDQKHDLIQSAVVACWQARHKITNINPFGYLSRVCFNAILAELSIHNKQEKVRAEVYTAMTQGRVDELCRKV